MATDDTIIQAAEALHRAERPLLFLGDGGPSEMILQRLIGQLAPAVVYAPGARQTYAALAGANLGRYSFGKRSGVESAVAQSDCVLALDVDFSEFLTRGGLDFGGATLVHLFRDARCFLRGRTPAFSIRDRDGSALVKLVSALSDLPERSRRRWHERPLGAVDADSDGSAGIHPRRAVQAIQEALPDELWIALDIGGFTAHVLTTLDLTPGQRLFCPIEREGCMGEAMLAAFGLFDGLGQSAPVLVIVGDGGFAMVPPEIQRAAETGAHLVFLIWQNLGFQAVEEGLTQAYGPEHGLPSGVWGKVVPDFAAIARGWGVPATLALNANELRARLAVALSARGPAVVVARIDSTQASPMNDRFAQVVAS